MCHMKVYEEWSHLGVVSQCGDCHIYVHEKCVECGVVMPLDLQKLHQITGLWETVDEMRCLLYFFTWYELKTVPFAVPMGNGCFSMEE